MFRRTIAVATTLGLVPALCASLAGAAADADQSSTARADVEQLAPRRAREAVLPGDADRPVLGGAAQHARKLGVNLIVNESCPSLTATGQLRAIEAHTLAVLPIAAKTRPRQQARRLDVPRRAGGQRLDARDAAVAPTRCAAARSDGLLTFMTTGAGFYPLVVHADQHASGRLRPVREARGRRAASTSIRSGTAATSSARSTTRNARSTTSPGRCRRSSGSRPARSGRSTAAVSR